MRKVRRLLKRLMFYVQPLILPCTVFSTYFAFQAASLQEQQLKISEEQQKLALWQSELDSQIVEIQRQASLPVFQVGINLVGLKGGKRLEELQVSAERNFSYDLSPLNSSN